MKISYDKKTDFMAIRFKVVNQTYVEDFTDGVDMVFSERDDQVIGFDLYNASESILDFQEVTSSQKLAMLIKLHRKCAGMTQEDLHRASNIPLPTIKMIEKGEKDTSIDNVAKIKRVLPDLDMNAISVARAS